MSDLYFAAFQEASEIVEIAYKNFSSWPDTLLLIKKSLLETGNRKSYYSVRISDDTNLLPHQLFLMEVERLQKALDVLLNALHYAHKGAYPLNYIPRRPHMAGQRSDPWVAAHTMKTPLDQKTFKAALHGMLLIRTFIKNYDQQELIHKSKEIGKVLQPIIDSLHAREMAYATEHLHEEFSPKISKISARSREEIQLPPLPDSAIFTSQIGELAARS